MITEKEITGLITTDRLTNYIRSLEPERGELLERIRKEALAEEVPIIRDETAALLKCLISAVRPKTILEIGTAVGYSALTMAAASAPDARILTIENYEPRIEKARQNIGKSLYADRIELWTGDAGPILEKLRDEGRQFDLIFMDAAKGQYPVWLPDIRMLLRVHGMLISDNILQDGSIADSRFLIERRDRTIHSRLREYLFTLKHTPELETAVLTVGDGVAVSVKKRETGEA